MQFFSYDLLTRQIVDEIPFSTWRYNEVANKPGGWSATIQASNEKATPDLLTQGRHALFFAEGARIWFGGMLWDLKVSPNGILTVGGEGMWSYFRDGRRNIRTTDLTFTNAEQFQIVVYLLALAQGGEAAASIGLTPRFGSFSGVTRTRTIAASERKSFAQVIEDFASADDGFDFAVNCEWNGNQPALFLDLYHPQRGTTLDAAWELGTHVGLSGDWTRACGANLVDGIGQSTAGTPLIRTATGIPNKTLRLEEVITYTDVNDAPTLLAMTRGELKRANKPTGTANVEILDHDELALGTWAVGDTITLSGDIGYTVLADLNRITGYEVSSDVDGAETVKVDLEPA